MITLKGYQTRSLDSLQKFLVKCAKGEKPADAFEEVQRETGAPRQDYYPVEAPGLSKATPYVCLRVPTGGGKTLMACHAAGSAITDYLRAERGVIVWLVPSTAILEQTANALRDSRHPYRRALETACGAVEVVTIEEALRLSRATADGATVVVVATMQAFKSQDPTGRRVYSQNGHFSEHLLNVPAERIDDLLPGPDGKPVPSLVNALRLRRPVVIVDEAHNARTELSFGALGDLRPSCVLEFTATPARAENPSNVLHQVSAAELKAANMAKLPVRVITRHPGQKDELLAEAVALRRDLEKLAIVEGQKTGEYIRPILLIQADRVGDCEGLRDKLVAEQGLALDEVKISVGTNKELDEAGDISLPKSPVRVIITVQHLKEGWDCPFAYVLCSLRQTRSATAIEQIVGRVLRLPNAKAKQDPHLNCSFVFSVSPTIGEVLKELRDALVANGFSAAEAGAIIRPAQSGLPLSAAPRTVSVTKADIDTAMAERQTTALGGKAAVDAKTGTVTIFVPLAPSEVELVAQCVKTEEGKAAVRELAATVKSLDLLSGGNGESRPVSFYEKGAPFAVPLLSVKEPAGLFEFEDTHLLEHPWKIAEKDAALAGYDPREMPKGRAGTLDIGTTGEVTTAAMTEEEESDFIGALHRQVLALGIDEDWSEETLVAWLDRRIRHQDIAANESAAFLQKAVRGVMTSLGLTAADISRDRFRLREAIEKRIGEHREFERGKAFQTYLSGVNLAVDESRAADFRTMMYEPSSLYEGAYKFKKHYFPRVGELEERTREEFACAQFLDDLPEVEYWVRNLARKPGSFRLLTPEGWFYPDFVCRLKDGRALVVEYKGAHLWETAAPKRAVGAAWAERSGGKGVFVMPTEGGLDAIRAAIK
ncbi:MAG: DEAD/DEAH box helicase family protein [Elusimicrobia bacterium]|nr:DEAD/DEAH box helicase family protein [Elusimicrobiota bacterium]